MAEEPLRGVYIKVCKVCKVCTIYLHVSIKLPSAFLLWIFFPYNISVMNGIAHLYGMKTETSSNKKSFYICDGHAGMIKLTACGKVIHYVICDNPKLA